MAGQRASNRVANNRDREELSRVIADNVALTERVQELIKQPSVAKMDPVRSVSSLSTSKESSVLSSDDNSISQRSKAAIRR